MGANAEIIDDEDEIVALVVKRRVAASAILAYMLDRHGIDRQAFFSAQRTTVLSLARHETWWLARQLTYMSLPNIARLFGGVDHSSIIYAIRKINEKMEQDSEYQDYMHQTKHDLINQFAIEHDMRDLEVARAQIAQQKPAIYRKALIEMLRNIDNMEIENAKAI